MKGEEEMSDLKEQLAITEGKLHMYIGTYVPDSRLKNIS